MLFATVMPCYDKKVESFRKEFESKFILLNVRGGLI